MDKLGNWVRQNCRFASAGKPLTASVAVFRKAKGGGLEVLIGKRANDPYAGRWALPGGRVDDGETIAEAAERELKEETGVKAKKLVFVGSKLRYVGDPDRERIDAVFAQVVDDPEAEASDDLVDVKWVKVNEMPDLAFDHGASVRAAKDILETPKGKRGKLVVLEGIDGSGKSTSAKRIETWLEANGVPFSSTKWVSSDLLKKPIKAAKEDRILTPRLFFLLHAADMILRYENEIEPALERNEVVVCDRYTYTSMVRDGLRGISPRMVRDAYKDMREPDLLLHCHVTPEEAMKRLLKEKDLSYYSAGMDLELAKDEEENCLEYERLMAEKYDEILPGERNYHRLEMDGEDETLSRLVSLMTRELGLEKLT